MGTPTRFNRWRCDWKRVLILHTRAISASFFRKVDLARARRENETTTNRAHAYEIPQNPSVLICLNALATNLAFSPATQTIPLQPPGLSSSSVRQGMTNVGTVRMEGGIQRALWELDLKALHFGDAAKRKHLSSASAPDCLCLQFPRELLQPSPVCENKPRSGEYYGDGNFLIVPTRVSVRSSEFSSLILSSLWTLPSIFSRSFSPTPLRKLADSEYFVK